MAGNQIKWMGASAARAQHIEFIEWERHKEELCRLYMSMTMDDLMKFMRIRYSFNPSRRQLVFQFRKWDVYKNEKRSDQDSTSRQYDDVKQQKRNRSSEHAANPSREHAGKPRPPVPMKKPKLRGKSLETLNKRIVSGPRESPNPAQILARFRQGAYDPPTLKVQKKHEITHVPSIYGEEVVTANEETDNEECGPPWPSKLKGENSCVDLVSQPSKRGTTLSAVQSSWKERLEADKPIESDSLEEIDQMKLRQTSYSPHSFTGIRLLWSSNYNTTSIIVSCARSCATPAQAEICRSLIEQKLANDFYGPQNSAESFVLRSLLADNYRKVGDEDAAKFHRQLARQSALEENRLWRGLPQTGGSLDLIAYTYLNRSLTTCGHFVSARDVTKQLIKQVPGPFEYDGHGRLGNDCLRSCLRWCIHQLRSDRYVYGSWQNIQSRGWAQRRIELHALFCDLWQRWQRQNATEAVHDDASVAWACEVEHDMGISPAELFILCRAILDACPVTIVPFPKIRDDGTYLFSRIQFEAKVRDRGLHGALALHDTSDQQLPHAFLEAYHSLYASSSNNTERADLALTRDYVRGFLQQSLQLELPKVDDYAEADDDLQAIARLDLKRSTNSDTSTFLPTLAASMSSLELRSIRSLKDRIQDLANTVAVNDGGGYCQLPSKLMTDVSLSSLSVSPMATSVRSTFTSVSRILSDASSIVSDTRAI